MQSVALSVGMELTALIVRDAGEIERAITAFAREPNSGLIVPALAQATVHRDLIISLAARYPVARGLSLPLPRHRRRSDLLRA